ncbi:MAG TPA: hypothetical protein VIV11_24760 [Kofleriaceae bacterium]
MVEPKYLIHDNIAIGGRIEAQVQFGGSFGENGDTKVSMGAVGAVLAKGEYLLGTGTMRPFAGVGIGMFNIVSQSVETGPSTASVDQKAGRYFGIAPQLGINLGRLRLAATYNMILGADIEVRQTVGGAMQTSTFSQSYVTFEMSFRFGGRRKAAAPRASEPMPAPVPAPAPLPASLPPPAEPAPAAPAPAAPVSQAPSA